VRRRAGPPQSRARCSGTAPDERRDATRKARLAHAVRELVDQAPELTAEQRQRLTAILLVRTADRRRRAASRDLSRRQLDAIAQQAAEDAALDQAIALTRAGRRHKIPPAGTLALAQAALARREGRRLTPAEIMAARYVESPDWDPAA
jgi:hypothetical protein